MTEAQKKVREYLAEIGKRGGLATICRACDLVSEKASGGHRAIASY